MIMIIVLTVLYREYTVSCYNTLVITCQFSFAATGTASTVDSSYCTVLHNTIASVWSHLYFKSLHTWRAQGLSVIKSYGVYLHGCFRKLDDRAVSGVHCLDFNTCHAGYSGNASIFFCLSRRRHWYRQCSKPPILRGPSQRDGRFVTTPINWIVCTHSWHPVSPHYKELWGSSSWMLEKTWPCCIGCTLSWF